MVTETVWTYVFGGIIFIALASLAVWFYLKWKLRRIDKNIKPEILNDYIEAERRYKDGGRNQNQILWDIAQNHFGGKLPSPGGREQPTEVRQINEQRESIQDGSSEQPNEADKRDKRPGWTNI